MFLKISSTEYVNTDKIIMVKSVGDMSCIIVMDNGGMYSADFPAETVMNTVREQQSQSDLNTKVLQQINQKVGNLPVFAG